MEAMSLMLMLMLIARLSSLGGSSTLSVRELLILPVREDEAGVTGHRPRIVECLAGTQRQDTIISLMSSMKIL
jgi:hypothetical protein